MRENLRVLFLGSGRALIGSNEPLIQISMDIRNYFYYLWRMKWKAVSVGIIFAVCGFVYTSVSSITTYEGVVFLTVGMEQAEYPQDAEAFGARGVTEADYYFAQTVQGWTMDPSFANDVISRLQIVSDDAALSISARQQERQNIIFSVVSGDSQTALDASQASLDELDDRLMSYNETMQTSYKIANPAVTLLTHEPNVVRNSVLGLLVGMIFVFVAMLCYEFLVGIVSFTFQVEKILGKPSIDPSYISKNGYILGVGTDVSKKYGRDVVHSGDIKHGNYVFVVKIGTASEKELQTLVKVVSDYEWITA